LPEPAAVPIRRASQPQTSTQATTTARAIAVLPSSARFITLSEGTPRGTDVALIWLIG
jgi:hypothetical protein